MGAEEEKKEEEGPLDLSGQQAAAGLGLALISMGEDIGSEMLIRTLSHLMRYCEPIIRRAVPLALALISVSNPQLPILDRQLMSPVAVAGVMSVLVALLDVKTTILGKSHYLLYGLATAMQPRMLVTFDTELRPLPVSVRVGNAVDVVGQAGKPKTITGFQTHTTPVLLAHGERAELATEEYIPVTSIMEGFVILKKNPDF